MPIVIYNGYTLPFVYGKFAVAENEKKFAFSCSFLVQATTSSLLVAACQEAEEKLTEKNKDFSLSLGGTGEFDFKHTTNTGFLARPTLIKITDKIATGTSRTYKFQVKIQLPFSQTPYNYRREGNFRINYNSARQRIVNFTCQYTAGGANSALINYNSITGGKAWAATILLALGGNFELINENFQEEQEEKILNATIQYQEILAKQIGTSVDSPAVINPSCNYSVDYAQVIGKAESSGYKTYPLTTVRINYNATINKDIIASDSDIEDVYQSQVKPWLISHAGDVLGLVEYDQTSTFYIVQSETKSVDPYSYKISGHLVFTAPKSSDVILELSEIVTENRENGIVAEKLWDQENDTYNIYSIGGRRTLQRMIVILKLNNEPALPLFYLKPPQLIQNENVREGYWIRLYIQKRKETKEIGQGTRDARLHASTLYAITYIEKYLWVVPHLALAIQNIGGFQGGLG